MKKNFYITTPIYYPSGKPHMGHAYSSILADIFARFKRLEGYNVHYLTGTDEHGLKIEREAKKNYKDTKAFCDEISVKFKDLTRILNLSNDDFIRTTEERHYKSVEEIWNRLIDSKDIYLGKYSGWYSISDEAYYEDDEIIEENNKKVAKSSGSSVDWVEEDSYFFKLSKWGDKLLELYKTNPKFILPASRRNEVIKFVEKGLKDLSVSRTSFSWGIPVPKNKKHIIYVWLDALTNYLSALNFPDTNDKLYKNFWPADIHLIGKDILRFHAIYWPAFLMASKLPLPKRVYGHGWILSDERKMSKSLGNILDPIDIINKYGIDQLRYYLTKEVSLGNDGNISLENLKKCINNDLANNFGNLCQRVFSFIEKNFKGKIPKKIKDNSIDKSFNDEITKDLKSLIELMDNQDLNSYIKKVVDFSFNANKYFNDNEPWSLKKSDSERMGDIVSSITKQILNITLLLSPIIPKTCEVILDTLNIKKEDRIIDSIKKDVLNYDVPIKKNEILFKKVDDDS